MDKYIFGHYKENIKLIIIFSLILIISLYPGIPILGTWESFIYYHNFASLETPVELRISRRASLSDAAIFSIGLSRIVSDYFNFYPTLYIFRILSVVYGFFTLVVFFIVLRRWFDLNTSLATVLLLSINPLFYFEQHTMNQLMISCLGFILLFERLQFLETQYRSFLHWLLLSIPLVLIFMHYGPGRVFATLFILFWFIKLFFSLRAHTNGNKILKIYIKNFIYTVIFSAIFLILIDWKNLISLIQFYNIFLPPESETAFDSSNPFLTFFQSFKTNIFILFETFTGFSNTYLTKHSTYVSTGLRSEILNPVMLIFFILGFIILIKNFKKNILLFSNPSISIIYLFFICLIPLISSTTFMSHNNNYMDSTLNSYRMFYLIFPIYLIIAIFLNFLSIKFKRIKKFNLLFILFIGLIYTLGFNKINDEKAYFTNKLDSLKNISNNRLYDTWNDDSEYIKNNLNSFRHTQMHGFYFNKAKKVSKLINSELNDFYILKLDTKQFHFIDDSFISEHNYVSVFFSFYLNNFGVKNSWIQIINNKKPKSLIGVGATPRFYSANVIVENRSLKYENLSDFKSYLRMNGNKIPKIILVTTQEELSFAMNYYEKNDIKSYQLLDI